MTQFSNNTLTLTISLRVEVVGSFAKMYRFFKGGKLEIIS